jgi:hypothetical protein
MPNETSGIAQPSSAINKYLGTPTNASFFQGHFNSTQIDRDPLITGYAFIKWLSVPSWVNENVEGGAGAFQAQTEKNFRALTGMTDIELATVQVQEGFSNSENHFAGGSQMFQGFTLSHREYSGSPIRRAYTHWVAGVRDPVTNIATYPAKYGLEYSAKNHTGELLYIVTRPDANNVTNAKIIEFACLYTMVMPTRIHLNQFNFTSGTNDGVEPLEQQFVGIPHISAAVDDLAVSKLNLIYPFMTMGEYVHATATQNAVTPA